MIIRPYIFRRINLVMTGKDYVVEAKERVDRLLSAMKTDQALAADPVVDSLAKACAILDLIKNKPTLKTRPGTNLAFPVYDCAGKLGEAWEDIGGSGDLAEFKEQIEDFLSAADTLNAALKERTVIMT
jgi:hypothetical protein